MLLALRANLLTNHATSVEGKLTSPLDRPLRLAHRGTGARQRPDPRDEQSSGVPARHRIENGIMAVSL